MCVPKIKRRRTEYSSQTLFSKTEIDSRFVVRIEITTIWVAVSLWASSTSFPLVLETLNLSNMLNNEDNRGKRGNSTFIDELGTYRFKFMVFRSNNSGALFQTIKRKIQMKISNFWTFIPNIIVHWRTCESDLTLMWRAISSYPKQGFHICHSRYSFILLLGEELGQLVWLLYSVCSLPWTCTVTSKHRCTERIEL